MNVKRIKLPITFLFGLLVIIIFCLFTVISALLYPIPWSPLENWLSDFGSSLDKNPDGAIFYNIGCIITGGALFPFYIGLYKWYNGIKLKWIKIFLLITQIAGCCSGFALIMIGVYSEDFIELHRLWSEIFFMLNLIVLIFSGIALFLNKKFIKIIAVYGWIIATINLSFLFFHTPLLEWFTVFTALGLAGLLAYNSYKAFKV